MITEFAKCTEIPSFSRSKICACIRAKFHLINYERKEGEGKWGWCGVWGGVEREVHLML